MQFKIEIDCNNEAFTGADRYNEVARILREAAHKLEMQQALRFGLRDINGNGVGSAEFIRD